MSQIPISGRSWLFMFLVFPGIVFFGAIGVALTGSVASLFQLDQDAATLLKVVGFFGALPVGYWLFDWCWRHYSV